MTGLTGRVVLYLFLTLVVTVTSLTAMAGGGDMQALGLGWDPPVNFFAFLMIFVLLLFAVLELRSPPARVPVILFLLTAFFFLDYFRQLPLDDYRDYEIYESSARALAGGQNPYATGKYYLYPPVFAQTLTAIYLWFDAAWGTAADLPGQARAASQIVHFLFQVLQYCLVLGCWWMAWVFVRQAGLKKTWAALLVTVLFIFNSPLLGTLIWNQTNLMVLASILAALILFDRRPLLAGACLAVGIEIKLYPVVLLLPFIALRRFKAPAGALAALAASFVLETDGLTDFTLWRQFLHHLAHFPQHFGLTNQNTYSLIFNTLSLGAGETTAHRMTALAFPLFQAAVGLLIVWRFVRREKFAHADRGTAADAGADRRRLGFHLTDMIAFFLLFSPITWQHQFVLALPLLAWAAVVRGNRHPRLTAVAFLSLNLLPLFFLYPFQYHRVAAIFLLLYITRPLPETVPDPAADLQRRVEDFFQPIA